MMQIVSSLKKRRTYYNIKKELPVSIENVIEIVEEITELVPDAFNMKPFSYCVWRNAE